MEGSGGRCPIRRVLVQLEESQTLKLTMLWFPSGYLA